MAISGALGFIEVRGLSSTISLADCALKAANVRLLGYEILPGTGWITVKITGDVGAVNAAVAAAQAAAAQASVQMYSLVIPRAHDDTKKLIGSILHPYKADLNVKSAFKARKTTDAETGIEFEEGQEITEDVETDVEAALEVVEKNGSDSETEDDKEVLEKIELEKEPELLADIESEEVPELPEKTEPAPLRTVPEKQESKEGNRTSEIADDEPVMKAIITCNLCNDPSCSRKRGQSHKLCIHYSDK